MHRGTKRGGRTRHARRLLPLASLCAAMLHGSPAAADAVEHVAVSGDRVTIRFDAAPRAAAGFVLAAPHRIAIDIDGVAPGGGGRVDGVVSAVRQGWRQDGARVVLDLARPMAIARGVFEDEGRVLSLTLAPLAPGRVAAASHAAPMRFLPWNWGADSKPRYVVSQAVPPPAKPLPLPKVQGDDKRPLVVIDAGHGGVDPGAINPANAKLREKDVTLKIARAIRDRLLASGRVRVALTRDDDRYILHRERFGIARRLKADLFISIHCDSVGSGNPTGATAYTLSDVASDKEAARLAARENRSDVIAGVTLDRDADVSSILIDLTQRETMNASAGFARLLGREAKELMPVKENFHRTASLLVLKAPDMPSILFETGYLSTPEDAAFLDSKAGRGKIAESVKRAVEAYFARRLAAK